MDVCYFCFGGGDEADLKRCRLNYYHFHPDFPGCPRMDSIARALVCAGCRRSRITSSLSICPDEHETMDTALKGAHVPESMTLQQHLAAFNPGFLKIDHIDSVVYDERRLGSSHAVLTLRVEYDVGHNVEYKTPTIGSE